MCHDINDKRKQFRVLTVATYYFGGGYDMRALAHRKKESIVMLLECLKEYTFVNGRIELK